MSTSCRVLPFHQPGHDFFKFIRICLINYFCFMEKMDGIIEALIE